MRLPDDVHMLPSLLGSNLLHQAGSDLLQKGCLREGPLHVLRYDVLLRKAHEDVLPNQVRLQAAHS